MGAILAAGRGRRMEGLGETCPKPLLPVCNKPVLVHQIEIMRSLGIEDVVVLIGYRGHEVAETLGDGHRYGVRIRYAEQHEPLGIAHAVGLLEPHVDRPFLLFLGDVFFIPGDLAGMMATFEGQPGGAVLATIDGADPGAIRRNFSVTISPDGFVTRVVEKPLHPPNRLKGVGVYLFDHSVFDAIRRTPRTALRNEYELTDAIQILIDEGHPVRAVHAIEQDVNITTPADLLSVNLRCLRKASLIGPNGHIHRGAHFDRAIVGPDVTISHPIRVRRSLIFARTDVARRDDIEHSIVTPRGVLRLPS